MQNWFRSRKQDVSMPRKPLTREERRNWFTLGAAAGGYLGCRLLLLWLSLPLGALLLFQIGKRGDRQRRRTWFVLGAAAAALWVGVYSLMWCTPAMALWGQTGPWRAEVTDYPERSSWGWSVELRLRPEGRLRSVPVLLQTIQSCGELKPGDRVSFEAQLCSPGRNHPARLHRFAARGILVESKTVKSVMVSPAEAVSLRYWSKAAHHALRQRILSRHGKEEAALLLALLTGDQDELKEPFATQLSRSGLRHIAAVSGLHVGVLMGAFLLLPVDRRLRQLLAAGALVFFCLVTGARPPVLRATVMGLALLLAPFLGRDADSIASVRTALLLLALMNPFSLESVSLQLSFAAVLGILRFGKPLYRFLMGESGKKKRGLRRAICASLALSLSAQVFTTPLIALSFGAVSLAAPLSNLFCLWAVELFFLGGAAGTLLGFLFPPVEVLWAPFHGCFLFVRWTAELFADAPLGAVTTQVFWYRLWLAAVYAVLLLLWRREKLRKRAAWFVPILLGLFLFCVMIHRTLALSGLGVEAVDVGQGQSILLLSRQQAAAVDCGGDNAGNALADAMYDAVEGELDLLVLTHFDADHIDGLEQLLRRVDVGRLLIPDVEDSSGGRKRVETLAGAHGVPVETIRENRDYTVGEMTLHLYALVGEGEDNNTGLAVLAEKGNFSVLITGDMDQDAELELLRREALGPVSVLVAGHHGSRSSSGEKFLEQIHPETAIISCGAENRYGHPSEEALERLKRAGCRIRRTDREGRISLRAPTEKADS